MPIMQVYMFEGRTLEQKRTLVANLTDAVVKSSGRETRDGADTRSSRKRRKIWR